MIVCKNCFKGDTSYQEVEFDYWQWFDATEDFNDPHGRYCDICGKEFDDGEIVILKEDFIMKTSAGVITTRYYDDGVAKGIQILLDDEIVCMLDVYEPVEGETEGEARVLAYSKNPDIDEPISCITINR